MTGAKGFATEGKRLLAEGRLQRGKGLPYGSASDAKWWGWFPSPEECTEIEAFDVPAVVLPNAHPAVGGFGLSPVAEPVAASQPLALVYQRAHAYALDNLGFEFGVSFTLTSTGNRLGTFYAGPWGWRLV